MSNPTKGVYAQIDVRLINQTMKILNRGTHKKKEKVLETIESHPEKYAPPVFYLLSNVIFLDGKKDEGAFWFYAGQLRARYDANRCTDLSAREAVEVLNLQYGSLINQYTLRDTPKLEALIPKVVDWDRKTPHLYDHRWINLHGMGAISAGLGLEDSESELQALSSPEEQWDAIAEKTRSEYLNGFKEAMDRLKKQRE